MSTSSKVENKATASQVSRLKNLISTNYGNGYTATILTALQEIAVLDPKALSNPKILAEIREAFVKRIIDALYPNIREENLLNEIFTKIGKPIDEFLKNTNTDLNIVIEKNEKTNKKAAKTKKITTNQAEGVNQYISAEILQMIKKLHNRPVVSFEIDVENPKELKESPVYLNGQSLLARLKEGDFKGANQAWDNIKKGLYRYSIEPSSAKSFLMKASAEALVSLKQKSPELGLDVLDNQFISALQNKPSTLSNTEEIKLLKKMYDDLGETPKIELIKGPREDKQPGSATPESQDSDSDKFSRSGRSSSQESDLVLERGATKYTTTFFQRNKKASITVGTEALLTAVGLGLYYGQEEHFVKLMDYVLREQVNLDQLGKLDVTVGIALGCIVGLVFLISLVSMIHQQCKSPAVKELDPELNMDPDTRVVGAEA